MMTWTQSGPDSETRKPEALSLLRRFYGYDSFRPGQWEIISQALAGNDSLVLMPTGGGKSLCYQIPALMQPGCCVVVSPLIALMNDQVTALRAGGVPAAALHSNLDERQNRDTMEMAARGELKLLYVSPERLMSDLDFIINNVRISLVAIDEAHCISQWGHDFRPVYTSLRAIKDKLSDVPVMALTATADRLTRSDISGSLALRDPFIWIGSFDRKNISLQVIPDPGKAQRIKVIANLVSSHPMDSGIVYCLSRKKTEQMHEALLKEGIRSVCYHAGMNAPERERAQLAFINGEVQVVCATVAFGMGIDKSNIRWVVHNNIPGNIESYYQEIGRAGRDGLPAKAILFYNFGDIIMRRQFAEDSGNVELNLEKLSFMQRYAEASICRRRILLSYFSEETLCDCGNCDNCINPRPYFDGTILAQKAISAAVRVDSKAAINMIVDILRGSNRAEIISKGFDKIKTYGAGRDVSASDWFAYILQMIQLGLFEVAYEESLHLRPTPLGMKVVRGEVPVKLVRPADTTFRKAARVASDKKTLSPEEELLDALKKLRLKMAGEEGIPPHVVASDVSLEDMVTRKPTDFHGLSQVNGLGETRLVKYGKKFLATVRKSVLGKKGIPVGYSLEETQFLFDNGHTVPEIAQMKGLAESTIYSHLASLWEQGNDVDFRRIYDIITRESIRHEFETDPEGAFDTLNNRLGIHAGIIRLARLELNLPLLPASK